jgi:transposase
MSIPGFGPITASAMAATIRDASSFAGPREFAAYLGLAPKQSCSGGKQRLERISKMGNRNLRKLLVVGCCFIRKPQTDPLRMSEKRLLENKPSSLSPWQTTSKSRLRSSCTIHGVMAPVSIPIIAKFERRRGFVVHQSHPGNGT